MASAIRRGMHTESFLFSARSSDISPSTGDVVGGVAPSVPGVTVAVSQEIFDGADAALSNALSAPADSLTIDFGNIEVGSGLITSDFLVHNLLSGAPAGYQLGLDLTAVDTDTAVFQSGLVPFDNLGAGSSTTRTASFDSDRSAGTYTKRFDIEFKNDSGIVSGLPDGTQVLTLHLQGVVTTPADFLMDPGTTFDTFAGSTTAEFQGGTVTPVGDTFTFPDVDPAIPDLMVRGTVSIPDGYAGSAMTFDAETMAIGDGSTATTFNLPADKPFFAFSGETISVEANATINAPDSLEIVGNGGLPNIVVDGAINAEQLIVESQVSGGTLTFDGANVAVDDTARIGISDEVVTIGSNSNIEIQTGAGPLAGLYVFGSSVEVDGSMLDGAPSLEIGAGTISINSSNLLGGQYTSSGRGWRRSHRLHYQCG